MAEQVQTAITMDDLLRRLAKDKRVEVLDGQFVEADPMAAGYLHLHIIGNIYDIIKPYVQIKKLGLFGSDGLTCVLHVSEEGIRTTRIPDLVFIKKENVPKEWDMQKPFPGAPDLAIEVVSPGEEAKDTHAKIDDYLRYGSSQVWVLYPDSKTLYQYSAADTTTARIYRAGETLQADDLFPDLELQIADFFDTETLDELKKSDD